MVQWAELSSAPSRSPVSHAMLPALAPGQMSIEALAPGQSSAVALSDDGSLVTAGSGCCSACEHVFGSALGLEWGWCRLGLGDISNAMISNGAAFNTQSRRSLTSYAISSSLSQMNHNFYVLKIYFILYIYLFMFSEQKR